MPSPTTITPAQLSRLVGTPDAPVIIDVRIDEDFDAFLRWLSIERPPPAPEEKPEQLEEEKDDE